MPPTSTAVEGIVTAAYRSGLKVDGAWRPYGAACPRLDIRPGDKVRCSLDGQGQLVGVEISERGSGLVPPDTISEGQKTVLLKILDDRELSVADLEERFLIPFKGKRLAELTKLEASGLLDFFFGKPKGGGPRGRGTRR